MKTIDNVKKRIIISMISILLLIITLFGITYAYFVSKVKGNENEESVSVKAGKLELTYEDGNGILEVGEYLQPGRKVKFKDSKGNIVESKIFTVTNTGTRQVDSYEVILENVVNELEYYEDLTYKLECKSFINYGEENQEEFGSCNGSNGYFPKTNGTLNSNSIDVDVTHYYVLTMEYAETHQDQSNDMQKNISAKINIQDNESSLNKVIVYGNSIETLLPNDYQQVEYIRNNTRTEYIDTGVSPSTNTQLEIDMQIEEYISNSANLDFIFGCRSTNADIYGRFEVYLGKSLTTVLNLGYDTTQAGRTILTEVVQDFKRHTYVFDSNEGTSYMDDVLTSYYTNPSAYKDTWVESSAPLQLYKSSYYDGGLYSTFIKIYKCKITKDGILVRNFIPCYRKSDNVVGLYDLVENKFYENAGTGTFLKGNDKSPTEIKSVGNYDTTIGKYKIPLKISGKNIFDIVDFAETYNSFKNVSTLSSFETFDGKDVLKMYGQLNDEGQNYEYMKGKFKENTQYTISLNYYQKTFNNIYGVSMYVKYTDGTHASVLTKTSSFEKWESIKFTSEKNKTIAFITLTFGTGGAYTYFDNFQIEEGTTATEYEPYKESIYNIYLDEPLRKVGNYVDYIDFMNYRLVRNVGVSDNSGTKPLEESLYGLLRPIQTNIELPTLIKEDIGNIEILTSVEPSKIEY